MEELQIKDLSRLKNGIPGFYRTRSLKLKLGALILVALLIIGGALTAYFIRANIWEGRVYIFAYSYSFYTNHLRDFSPIDELMEDRGLSRSEFESAAQVTFVERKTLTDELLRKLGIDEIVPSAEVLRGTKPYGVTRFYWVLLDGNGECLYQGINAADFIEALIASGF